jgi:hypothetical protein
MEDYGKKQGKGWNYPSAECRKRKMVNTMNKILKLFLIVVLCFLVHNSYSQTNPVRKAIYESKEVCITLAIFDQTYDNDDSISIAIDYKNKSSKNLFVYDPLFSKSRSDFTNVDITAGEVVLELGGSFLWDLGRPNALKLKKIRPYSFYHIDIRIKIPSTNHVENLSLFNDIFANKQHLQLMFGYFGYINNLKGIKLMPNGNFVGINEKDEYKEVKLFERNYCRILIGPLIVKIKN